MNVENCVATRLFGVAAIIACASLNLKADSLAPTVPFLLSATAATCGQVDLAWSASTDEVGGSGMKAYVVTRSDGISTNVGSGRTTFSDVKFVKSSSTVSYSIAAMDAAGNVSAGSNSISVTTPACSMAPGEVVVDGAAMFEPMGKTMATYGARSALLYIKQNSSNLTWDTWINISDSDTGQNSHFLLHNSPGYYQRESDYLFTSATDFWTLSWDSSNSGKLTVSKYKLNGTPPSSASLVSTKTLGDTYSYPLAFIKLQSGALMVGWNEYSPSYNVAQDLTTGFAYLSTTGTWSVKFPVTVTNTTSANANLTQMALVQHPADHSIWAFEKRDGFYDIGALHFTEVGSDFNLDWINTSYISHTADGNNSPEGEFPFLAGYPDPTRNAILLAYQNVLYQFVYIDPYTFLKEAPATIAVVQADGSKSFMSTPIYMERAVQFGMSVQTDGTIWLEYNPINHQALVGNDVYAAKYSNNAWSTPVMVGSNYGNFYGSGAMRNPGVLIYRNDQPQVAFVTPDQKVHTFAISGTAPAQDTIAPTTSITSPANGATVSGTVTVTANASDNVAVTKVNLLVDGAIKSTVTSSPYTFSWDSSTVSAGNHTLQTVAYDVANNTGSSALVTVTVSTTAPTTSIVTPTNGATVSGMVSVSANASANVVKMDFKVDGVVKSTKNGAPYNFSWDTTTAGNGNHVLQTVAYDASGNTGSSPTVTDMVSNTVSDTTPPTVSITSPVGGSTVSRNTTVTITSAAADNVGVSKVEFYVNGVLQGTDTAGPYNYSWKVPGKNNAVYSLTAIAYDAAGNKTTSGSVSVTGK